MRSFSVSESISATSTSAATTTNTSTTSSQDSQFGTADGQRPRRSSMDLSITIHTPEPSLIPTTYHQQDELGLLSKLGTTQINPFEALATYITATFDDCDQGQSASSLSLFSEPSRSQRSSQPVEDLAPIVRKEPSTDPTDKWIVMGDDKKRPFQCGYKCCGRKYSKKEYLQTHFVTHIGDSKLRCYLGECAGIVIYPDTRRLTQHIHAHHSFERMFECKICHKRFRLQHHLKYHREHVHSPKKEKKSPKPQSVSKSSSAATATITTTSTSKMTSGVSQSKLAAGQRQKGAFVDLSKTLHTPESAHIPATDQHFSELRLLAAVSTSQIKPFEARASHQTVTFENEAVMIGIAGVPNLPSDQYQAEQSPDPTDTNNWFIVDKSQERPYRCGYPGCDNTYTRGHHLRRHLVKHTGTSKFKCPHPECVGNEYFGESALLKRHIASKHALDKPFPCDRCNKQFMRKESLKSHTERVHSPENEQQSPIRKKK